MALTLFNIPLKVLANPIKQKKEVNIIKIGKKEIKLFLFINNIIVLYQKTKNQMKKYDKHLRKFSMLSR